MTARRTGSRAGFTLMEVLIAAVMLAVGCIAILSCMMQCQRMMLASKRFESAQLVLQLGEMAHPIPDPSQVTTSGEDIMSDDLLNVSETPAEDLVRELEMELPRTELEQLKDYTFERTVDETDDEILQWNGGIYAIRSTVRCGGRSHDAARVHAHRAPDVRHNHGHHDDGVLHHVQHVDQVLEQVGGGGGLGA